MIISSFLSKYAPQTIIPLPVIEREKKACPIAFTQVSTLNRYDQSGTNKYLYPSIAPGKNATLTANMKNSTKKAGIIILFVFSILEAPAKRVSKVIIITAICQGRITKFPCTASPKN